MAAGIYLHIPFCKSRCSYCDFATDVYRNSATVEKYVNALCAEIKGRTDRVSGWNDVKVDTLYFGGGTPSLLTAKLVEQILKAVNSKFDISNLKEITMEMNPATVTRRMTSAAWQTP